MNKVIGRFKKVLYDNGTFLLCLFKVDDSDIKELIKQEIKTIGLVSNIKIDFPYVLEGIYENDSKYGYRFNIKNYEVKKPSKDEEMILFLSSSFVKGCGKETAKKIVNLYHEDTLNKIKEDLNNLLVIPKMTYNKAFQIKESIEIFDANEKYIKRLSEIGFSFEDSNLILKKHFKDIIDIINGDLYILNDLFEFSKIDILYQNNFDKDSSYRLKNCIVQTILEISFQTGSVYFSKEEILSSLYTLYKLSIDENTIDDVFEELKNEGRLVIVGKRYYLSTYYNQENNIANLLYQFSQVKCHKYKSFEEDLKELEDKYRIKYNDEQKKAIRNALENNVSIISGGPGTGKTTIIKAICELYISSNRLSSQEIIEKIALLAPTGRAAKKMSEACLIGASTIHRYLKWHKEEDYFEFNKDNKLNAKLVIVDETSMLDINLLSSLLDALNNPQIIFVGDTYQLPSVGVGNTLSDMIKSDFFSYTQLNEIYRQSDNSYIPFLAKDIKCENVDDEFLYKRDDYSFVVCDDALVMPTLKKCVLMALEKGINEDKMQVLIPIYKGINGIDEANKMLQEIYNPKSLDKEEILYNGKIFRQNDKVLQLINDSDNNVFNGDIGRILGIYSYEKEKRIQIDFDGNIVYYTKKDLKNITHAYAISVHKSQGSEFDHVLFPVCKQYFLMMYNKLLYTGVSRAKKSLTLIGNPKSFTDGIRNNYSKERKTSLLEFIANRFKV